jgi:GDP-L-fucose synthase
MDKNSKIFVAGHNGLVGSSLVRLCKTRGFETLLTVDRLTLELKDQSRVFEWFDRNRPEYVFLAAARVGGIHANNTYPAEFIYDNIQVQNNVIEACRMAGVKKLLFLGSVCIYPKFAPEPVNESALLTGELEPTNQWYAVAKIAGIKMCQAYRKQYGCDYISVMPCNLYGINDNFHPENSHVLPALIRKFDEAKMNNAPTVTCWGTGAARREFLNVDDMASASVFLMEHYSSPEIINIGYGADHTIKEIAELIQQIVGYQGRIVWDTSKPDGTPRRLLDTKKLADLGWKPKIDLVKGLTETYRWYKNTFPGHLPAA